MLGSALDYPTSGDDGARAVLVGGVLTLLAAGFALAGLLYLPFFGAALLCHLLVRGYYVRVLRLAAGDPGATAPAFDRWGDLLTDGVKAVAVAAVYAVPALALFAGAAGGQFVSAVGRPAAALGVLPTLTGLSVLLLLLYLLAAAYLLPAAVASFAHAGRLRAAVDRRVLRAALDEEYAFAWVASLLFQLVAVPVALLLGPLVVGFFVQFIVGVATRHVWGRGFGAALDLDPVAEAPAAADSRTSESPGPATGGTRREGQRPTGAGTPPTRGDAAGTERPTPDDAAEGPGDGSRSE